MEFIIILKLILLAGIFTLIFGGAFILQKFLCDWLPSTTNDAKLRERDTIKMVKMRDALDAEIQRNMSQSSIFSQRRIIRKLGG